MVTRSLTKNKTFEIWATGRSMNRNACFLHTRKFLWATPRFLIQIIIQFSGFTLTWWLDSQMHGQKSNVYINIWNILKTCFCEDRQNPTPATGLQPMRNPPPWAQSKRQPWVEQGPPLVFPVSWRLMQQGADIGRLVGPRRYAGRRVEWNMFLFCFQPEVFMEQDLSCGSQIEPKSNNTARENIINQNEQTRGLSENPFQNQTIPDDTNPQQKQKRVGTSSKKTN